MIEEKFANAAFGWALATGAAGLTPETVGAARCGITAVASATTPAG